LTFDAGSFKLCQDTTFLWKKKRVKTVNGKMNFISPLYRASLIERTAGVLADACLENGQIVTAYCPNGTRLKGLSAPQTEIWLAYDSAIGKRLHFRWELSTSGGAVVGIDSDIHTALVLEAVNAGALYELSGYRDILPATESSALDLRFVPADARYPECFAAIAPVYAKKGVDLLYPDAVYTANRHVLNELEAVLNQGGRAVLLLIAQRIDCLGVKADWTADGDYIAALKNLCDKGLEIICCGCTVSVHGVWISARLPFSF